MTERMGPSYQLVAGKLRSRITAGELAVGDPIPSTRKLQEQYQQSETVIRRAVRELQEAGILIGHPGKGVYVQALPDVADSERGDLRTLGKQVAGLEEQVADLRERFGRMEARLATMPGKPRGGQREQQERSAGSGRR